MRALFLHAKAMSDEDIDLNCSMLKTKLENENFENVSVVSGRDDFKDNAATAGGWQGWPRDLISRTDSETYEPFYDLFVVPGKTCGKGTAAIVKLALEAERPVVWWDSEDTFYEVAECAFLGDNKNFWSGWELR